MATEASGARQAVRVALLVGFLLFGVLCFVRGSWFGVALTVAGVAAVIAAPVRGEAP